MLAVANVRTAGGAANYFAADNYYTRADADRSGHWFGNGAERLGLSGEVDAATFEAILKGFLPDGNRVGSDNRPHRPGTDLTFNLPKSWSIIALVGGDSRIVEAYADAVRETLAWAEKNLAETRMEVRGREKVVATGNIVAALFVHDTNRNQEPNAHIHAVVANVTQGPDGKWRALRNDRLWEHNTLLNAMTMARFRHSVEGLGYEAGPVGKHGNFEAAHVPKEVRDMFSTRRAEVLAAVAQMENKGPRAVDAATRMTRAEKKPVENRAALTAQWREAASTLGFNPDHVIARANARAAENLGEVSALRTGIGQAVERGRQVLSGLAERLGLRRGDPLVPRDLAHRPASEVAAIHAVAAGVRHLSEREAAFERTDLYKAALGFGLAVMPDIERRVAQLERQGELLKGKGAERGRITTKDALSAEQRIVAEVEAGRGQAPSILPAEVAGERLQGLASLKYGLALNGGQEAAGRLLISSHNRIVAIQGVAGAGKSTMLRPVADLLREEGRQVLGIAVQNTLVQMLERETGIASMTVARFLRQHSVLLEDGGKAQLAAARQQMRGTVVLLDEASMVGNADKENLVRLANLLELGRFASIGDRKQLGAVDAGKPFDVMQQAGVETATMNLNIRARDKTLRLAQSAAQGGKVEEALRHLGANVVEVGEGAALEAAVAWLALAPDDRERTAIYASGRKLRSEVNEAVQTGLKANGELGQPGLRVETLSRVSVTREELRHVSAYVPGMIVEVDRHNRSQGLVRGSYQVVAVDQKSARVELVDSAGRTSHLGPGKLRPHGADDPLRLYEIKPLEIHAGDRIRWTDTDHKRGLLNADQARIVEVGRDWITLATSSGAEHQLSRGDPMLRRLDLAYALNAHMAQGLTSDRGIAVMDSRERNLSNQQTFLVTITRLRDGLTLYVDNAIRLERTIERNAGMKLSALETVGRLRDAAAAGVEKGRAQELQPASEREAPGPDLSLVKPFEIGI